MYQSFIAALCLLIATPLWALETTIVFLSEERENIAVLSNLDPIPEDIARAGFDLGIADNQSTGKFLKQTYKAHHIRIPLDADPKPFFTEAFDTAPFIVADLTRETLLSLADHAEAEESIIFNTFAQDNELRDTSCRANLFHTAPSYAMRSDALAQALVKKRWTKVAMIHGTYPEDILLADAMRASITKFGLKLRSEKPWDKDADIRRSAANEVPLFTQELKDHDALIVIDEADDFGRYIPYNTWLPRPIVGTQGMRPVAWDRTAEQWGAAQLQSRFMKLYTRMMQPRDYAAWAAVRTIGEAVVRTNANDAGSVRTYMLSDAFELAGFKGRPLSYRRWNGQLRQPIILAAPNAVVANTPLDGFLHQHNELDTLGVDQPNSKCTAFD